MTEFTDRVDLEELDFDSNRQFCCEDPFAPTKLLGVAVFGALAALAGYYVYAHLDGEKRNAIRDCVISVAKEQVNTLTASPK